MRIPNINSLLVNFLKQRPRGFTIVELLIVIVVIAILAAITIVAYNGITSNAIESSMKSDLRNAATTLELHKSDSAVERYPDTAAELNNGAGLQGTRDNTLVYRNKGDGFCVSVTNVRVGVVYRLMNGGNITEGDCSPEATVITGGQHYACAIADGQAYCWGSGGGGQLGNGSTGNQTTPVAVDMSGVLSGKTVTAITGGGSHTCAIADGQAYCWGSGGGGQLGNGSTGNQTTPVAVDMSGVLSGKTVTAIAAGNAHTCALADSKAYCWGWNLRGQLGNGTTDDQITPVAVDTSGVLSGKTVTAIAAGHSHTCAVADGQAYCWGMGTSGRLGISAFGSQSTPVAVDTSGVLSGKIVTAIATGYTHTCALANGQAYCWGAGGNGRLGNGATGNQTAPVAVNSSGVLSGETLAAITAINAHTCALAEGQVYCWGAAGGGQLGSGATDDQTTPVAVDMSGALSGKIVTKVATGYSHTCALAEGQVYCWGAGSNGQLGNDATTNQLAPSPISPFPEI